MVLIPEYNHVINNINFDTTGLWQIRAFTTLTHLFCPTILNMQVYFTHLRQNGRQRSADNG